jgi:Arc/MetJ-type ribon-helix-helix transcriptional regulator
MPSEKISLLLPRDVLDHVRRAAASGGETLDEFVRAALTERLSRLTASADRRRAAAAEWSD